MKRKIFLNFTAFLFGIGLCVALMFCLEIGFRLVKRPPWPVHLVEKVTESEVSQSLRARKNGAVKNMIPATGDFKSFEHADPDLILGLRPAPQGRYKAFYRKDGKISYDTFYSHDEFGRRLTIQNHEPRNTKHAIFTGCSFTYGEGVSDKDTLPSQFAKAAKGYNAYNYAMSAWGPQQNVLRLEHRQNLSKEVKEKEGFLLYVWIHQHIQRVIGSFSTWPSNRRVPAFALDSDGKAQYMGFFPDAYPTRDFLFSLLAQSAAIKGLRIDWPIPNRSHYQLAARILLRLRDDYLKAFPKGHFGVLIWPDGYSEDDRIVPALRAEKIPVVILDNVVAELGREASYQADFHPTPAANAAIAKKLAKQIASLKDPLNHHDE